MSGNDPVVMPGRVVRQRVRRRGSCAIRWLARQEAIALRALAGIALCSSITCVGAETSSPVGLADTLRAILQARNPVISRVAFREIRSINYGRYYYAIGWGVRADMTFRGSFEDELFAVVRIDSSLTRITGVLDLIPSPRWLDYTFEIDAVTGDSLIVAGRGDTYGDGPQRRAYARPEAQ